MKALPDGADEATVRWCSFMDAIRLLPAPVNSPSERRQQHLAAYPAAKRMGMSGSSTGLVPVVPLPLASRSPALRSSRQSESAFSSDNYVWSVSAGGDGSFNFYAVPRHAIPRQSYGSSSSPQSQGSASPWAIPQNNCVPAQYAMYAGIFAPVTTHLLDLYA